MFNLDKAWNAAREASLDAVLNRERAYCTHCKRRKKTFEHEGKRIQCDVLTTEATAC